jgi:hypothetical protein
MKTEKVGWKIILTLFIFLGLLLSIKRAIGSFPPSMVTSYAGFVKPQPVPDYIGDCGNDDYSTCYLGGYITIEVQGVHKDEGGGSHPGVDIISNRVCAQTQILAVTSGEVVELRSDWRDTYPDLNACGSNDGLTPLTWGNYVVIRNSETPGRDGFRGAHILYMLI